MEKILEILESSAPLSLEQYCDLAIRTEKQCPKWVPGELASAYRFNHAVLGLNSEVHEYNAALRNCYGSSGDELAKARVNLSEEIGDFWWYTAVAWKSIGSKPVVTEVGAYIRDWALSILSDEAKRGFIYQKPMDMDKICKALGSMGTWLMRMGPTGLPGTTPEEAASKIWKANLAKLEKRHGKAYADLSGLEYNRDREQEALTLEQHLKGGQQKA